MRLNNAIRLFKAAFLLASCSIAMATNADKDNQPMTFPLGDPRACLSSCGLRRLEVLPGAGWDNLRNVDAGAVVALNYSQCRTTDDGKYLIPDLVNAYPIMTSRLDSYAEIIQTYDDYVSSHSKSINLNVGYKGIFDISGRFSDEYMYTKRKQLEDDTFTTRVQARYVKYRVVLQPDMPLNEGFKYRLLSVADSLELGNLRQARFDSQQLVREFGTHVSISVDAGAAIVQEEQIHTAMQNTSQYTKTGVKRSASLSFGANVGLFFGGVSTETVDQKMQYQAYMDNRTDSVIRTMGGNIVNNTNTTTDDWIKGVEDNLVAIDRDGEPIFNFINAQTLPEIPASTLLELGAIVEEAVMTYYKVNTHPGCTQRDMANFSPQANKDDGSCKPPTTSSTNLGGIYQTCNSTSADAGDLCPKLTQKNPLTGDFSCPQGYEAVSLYSGTKTHAQVNHVCTSCWLIFGHCCHDEAKNSTADYETFWCAKLDNEVQGDGFMFGGVYTHHMPNPVTSAMSCPHAYLPLKMGEDIKVCVSDQYLDAVVHSLPFAGFFSCSAGNPLALGSGTTNKTGTPMSALMAHMYSEGPGQWPRRCPLGYSQFTTALMPDDGCEVNHCVQPGALADHNLPSIQRPPFIHAPVNVPVTQNVFVFDPAQKMWLKNGDAPQNVTFFRHGRTPASGMGRYSKRNNEYVFVREETNYRINYDGEPQDGSNVSALIILGVGVSFLFVLILVIVLIARKKTKPVKKGMSGFDNKGANLYVLDIPNKGE